MNTKKLLPKILIIIAILLNGLFAFIGFWEFYIVGIKKETENYPFGGEGPVAYFYKSAELYAKVNLVHGLVFGILFALSIWNLKNGKFSAILILGLTLIAIFIQAYHSWTG